MQCEHAVRSEPSDAAAQIEEAVAGIVLLLLGRRQDQHELDRPDGGKLIDQRARGRSGAIDDGELDPESLEELQDAIARLLWLKQKWASWNDAPNLVSQLGDKLPPEELGKLTYVEAFERCESGGQLTKDNVKTLFPFGIVNF